MAKCLPTAYLNGEYLPIEQARISPLDRSFLFSDGVYEVVPAYAGKLFLLEEHLDRLDNSLRELAMTNPHSRDEWRRLFGELVAKNGGGDQVVYLQVSRGAEDGRDHRIPQGVTPTVFMMSSPPPQAYADVENVGIKAVTVNDIRWGRCDIKSVSLLANILARQSATDAGCQEAILVRDGEVIEASSSSVFIVQNGVLVTCPKSHAMLPGITQALVLNVANELSIPVEERRYTTEELYAADEVWIMSSTREVSPATQVDDQIIADGKPGPMWRRIRDGIEAYKRKVLA